MCVVLARISWCVCNYLISIVGIAAISCARTSIWRNVPSEFYGAQSRVHTLARARKQHSPRTHNRNGEPRAHILVCVCVCEARFSAIAFYAWWRSSVTAGAICLYIYICVVWLCAYFSCAHAVVESNFGMGKINAFCPFIIRRDLVYVYTHTHTHGLTMI